MLKLALIIAVLLSLTATYAVPRISLSLSLRHARAANSPPEIADAYRSLKSFGDYFSKQDELAFRLGVLSRRLGQIDTALAHLRDAKNFGYPSEAVRIQIFMARCQAGDLTRTEGFLKNLLDRRVPAEIGEQIYEALAKGYLAQSWLHEAKTVIDYWLLWQPENSQAHFLNAQLFEHVESLNNALKEYQAAAGYCPRDVEVRLGLADCYLALGDVDASRSEFLRVNRQEPTNVRALLGLSVCERRLANPVEAVTCAERVLSLKAADANERAAALTILGELSVEKGDLNSAIRAFQESLALSPRDVSTHYSLAHALVRVGEQDEARQHFRETVTLKENNRRIAELARQVRLNPRDTEIRYELGKLTELSGNPRASYQWWMSALHIDPTHRATHEALAQYHRKNGNLELSRAHSEMAEE